MQARSLTSAIREQTDRALWEVGNVIRCIPDELWEKRYCGMPLFKHVYHMLHSLDQWYINPDAYEEPPMHEKDLNNLDVETTAVLDRPFIEAYLAEIRTKLAEYHDGLTDEALLLKPEGCAWTRLTLILAQHRHLHTHMGMIMGFIVAETGRWPYVIGLTRGIPGAALGMYF